MRDLVLVGGGHAHVHVLKSFGMKPVAGLRVAMIARDVETPYSGMLPGLIAGHYRFEDCHVDLRRLADWAGARLIHGEACGLDRAARHVLVRDQAPVPYDFLSIDIGSTPAMGAIPGAAEHAIAVKPIDRLAARWEQLLQQIAEARQPLTILVVGGGAAGVEMTLAMQHRLASAAMVPPRFGLATRDDLLPQHNARTQGAFRRILAARDIALHCHAEVVRVEADAVFCRDGRRIGFDVALWATQAGAAAWLAETGLDLAPGGFIAVDAALRSVNDPLVFAVGDVAAVLPYPREKAGVFAVRQGPPLAANLRRVLAGQEPRPFVPQRHFLGLISTGDRYAIATRGPLFAEGRWVWRLKDWIDRRWMRQYQNLPPMPGSD